MSKFVIFFALFVSTAVTHAASAPTVSEQIPGVYAALEHLNGQSLACSKSADCAAIPTGSRACGGPNGYIVASRESAHYASVKELAKLTESLENQENIEKGLASICMFEEAPDVECNSASQCAAKN